jgi:two-component system sensor histidine kinase DegS
MNITRSGLTNRYLAALRAHLAGGRTSSLDRATVLGRAALSGRMATLDLALMHESAMVALAPTCNFADLRNGSLKRSGRFFTRALVPLESAERATRLRNQRLKVRNQTLNQMTADLAKGNRELKSEIRQRVAGEVALKKGREEYRKLFLESLEMQKKLQHLTRQIISAQEQERKEISRELHDQVVQTLVGINVELAALGTGASAGLITLKAKIARTQRLVEHSVKAVHRFARELRPAVLDDLGLIPAIHAYSKSLAARTKIKILLTAFAGVEALPIAKRTVLFRVAQEALTNATRHAEASQIKMTIVAITGAIRMEISDNGKSFPVGKIFLARNHRRLGLIGMKERIEMVGGTLSIESTPGIGTTVRAEIPYKPSISL